MKQLYSRLAEILEVNEIYKKDILDDFEEWDSLGALSVIAMIDENYDVLITNSDLRNLITVGDLEDLIKAKKGDIYR